MTPPIHDAAGTRLDAHPRPHPHPPRPNPHPTPPRFAPGRGASLRWICISWWLRARNALAAGACLLLMLACGGGGEGGGVGEGGTGTFVSGPITGFGSVLVAGVKLDDGGASLSSDDEDDPAEPLPQPSQLQPGMVVAIEAGAISTDAEGNRSARAQRIRVAGSLIGPVTDVNLLGRSLRVMGLRVRLDAATVFDATLRERLAQGLPLLGQVVEVWGYVDPQLPGYRASFVKLRPSPHAYKARGLVRSVDAASVDIGGQLFDFSGVADRPRVGQLVRVTVDPAATAEPWPVRRWRTIGSPGLRNGDTAQAEGTVTARTDSQHFDVNGVPVVANGTDPAPALGDYVKVEGPWRNGALQADKVEVQSDTTLEDREFRWDGIPSAHDAVNRRFTVTTDSGRTVVVSYAAGFGFEGGNAATLDTGRALTVRGRWRNGELVALRIRFR